MNSFQSSQGQELHLTNNVSSAPLPTNVVAGESPSYFIEPSLNHSVFSAKTVNRRAYGFDTWVLDTRATDHIICSKSLLTTITIVTQTVVELPNGETARVTHIGTITLSSELILINVLCVPLFSFNLLSISRITKSQLCCLVFLSSYYFTQDLICWKTIGVGQVLDGLYLLQCSSLSQVSPSLDDFLSTYQLGHFSALSSIFWFKTLCQHHGIPNWGIHLIQDSIH